MKIRAMLPRPVFELEKWKYNIQYNVYVSSFGRLKDENKKLIQPCVKNNYLVYITPNGGTVLIHRLVMGTFRPVAGWNDLTVDHNDHNTRNNRLSNLEWVTAKENTRRAIEDNSPLKNEIKNIDNLHISTGRIQINAEGSYDVEDAVEFFKEKITTSFVPDNVRKIVNKCIINGTPVQYGGYVITREEKVK